MTTMCGWARTIRDMKTFGFIELNDGSCFKNLQVVMSAEALANYKAVSYTHLDVYKRQVQIRVDGESRERYGEVDISGILQPDE